MPYSWRLFRPMLFVAVLATVLFPIATPVSLAQEGQASPVIIQGTPELEDLVTAIRDAYATANQDAQVTIDPGAGLRTAFQGLCQGQVDIVMSTEPITDAQIRACTDQGQTFVETVLAYEAIALLTPPAAQLTCLAQQPLFDAWQLGAKTDLTWSELGSEALDAPVSFYGPDDLSLAYLLFKKLVPAGALREDIVMTDDPAAIVAKVQEENANAFAFLSLADLSQADPEGALTPLQVQDVTGACISPTLETLEDRTYPLARTDYLYINAASAERPEVKAFIEFALTGEEGVKAHGPALGYVLASDDIYATGAANVRDVKPGRTFSRPVSPVQVSASAEGTVRLAGSALLYDLTRQINREFTSLYANATIETTYHGNTAGWQSFCAGETDVLAATRPPTDDELAQCQANGVTPFTLDLGYQALVIAVPAEADWVECLDGATAAALWRAGNDETPAAVTWRDANPDWPDRALLLVAPPRQTGETDFLISRLIGNLSFAVRTDMVEDDDPLYRAQGVANTDNGLTYLWWTDFQGSTADVKLLSADAGQGCVAPSAESFADGSYPLAFPVRYYVNQAAFNNALLRAYLWHFFDETSIETLAKYPFAGFDFKAYGTDLREEVYNLLAAYEQEATSAAAPAATATATPMAEQAVTETPAAAGQNASGN
ncbi:MAG: substrate-binding domain-containing protein [Aggregatilineaceae bacterium]